MGAPKNNQNAVRHGLRARRALTTVSLGKGFESCLKAANDLRARQEARIRAQGREPTEKEVRRIQRAALLELRSRAAGKRHRDLAKRKHEQPGMSTAEFLELHRQMRESEQDVTSAALDADKILDGLGLDSEASSPFAFPPPPMAVADGEGDLRPTSNGVAHE